VPDRSASGRRDRDALQDIVGQWGIKIVGHGELAFGKAAGALLGRGRRKDGQEAGSFFGQALRAFGQNVSVINFNFNGQITHGMKLNRLPSARKRRFTTKWELNVAGSAWQEISDEGFFFLQFNFPPLSP